MDTHRNFVISIFFVTLMGAVMLFTESKSGAESGIIVKVELAPSVEAVEQLIGNYKYEQLWWLRLNTKLDFIFILVYTGMFFFALTSLMSGFKKAEFSKSILAIAMVPGILDVIENLFILNFLQHDFNTGYFIIYYWCVHAKWVLVAAFILISLIALLSLVRARVRSLQTKLL